MIEWKYIMLHHSLTKDGITANWDAIRRYHMEVMGWKDIGYHFGVELVGDSYVIQKGRPLTEFGAHCKEGNMNRQAIGICCVGNFDEEPPPPQQLDVLRSIVLNLLDEWHIPIENIVPHNRYAPYKSCPGRLFPFQEFVQSLRQA